MFLGYFDDWRTGMETYGEANNINTPRLNWDGGNVFGYSSWNAHMENVTKDNMTEASDVMDGLSNFNDEDGIQWINIDSFWDNLTEDEIKEYVQHCKDKGQKVGIYWARYVDWGMYNTGNDVKDKYGDLVAIGKNGDLVDYLPLDPTSDYMKAQTKEYMEKFVNWGFEYLKVDFLNFSTLEGTYADSSVKTGLQAYNMACAEILKYIDTDHFFVDYSIAPLFPHQYAHARRVSCDIATEGWDTPLKEAKYMLNAVNYGWWQSKTLYEYLNPDQISIFPGNLISSPDEAESRAKYTTALITGMMVMSNTYDDKVKNIISKVATNEEVNRVARIGKSFRPLKATDPCPEKEVADYKREGYGDTYQDNDYVLKWEDGKPYTPDYISNNFAKLLSDNDLPHIRFYDLRHSCATNLLVNGVDLKIIQEYLGHSTIATTANYYLHPDIEQKKNALNTMSNSLKVM